MYDLSATDLAHVPPRHSDAELRRKVLVDNNPVSCVLNPDNTVLIRDWLGKDEPDEEKPAGRADGRGPRRGRGRPAGRLRVGDLAAGPR
ncbi:unnamed protein product, partial [Prorocentrum cordatum]